MGIDPRLVALQAPGFSDEDNRWPWVCQHLAVDILAQTLSHHTPSKKMSFAVVVITITKQTFGIQTQKKVHFCDGYGLLFIDTPTVVRTVRGRGLANFSGGSA